MAKWVRSRAVGIALVSVACGGGGATTDEVGTTSDGIIGGQTVPATADYPGISAFIGYGTSTIPDAQFCTAVMIAPGWVATAAHCVNILSDSSVILKNCRQAVDSDT